MMIREIAIIFLKRIIEIIYTLFLELRVFYKLFNQVLENYQLRVHNGIILCMNIYI